MVWAGASCRLGPTGRTARRSVGRLDGDEEALEEPDDVEHLDPRQAKTNEQ